MKVFIYKQDMQSISLYGDSTYEKAKSYITDDFIEVPLEIYNEAMNQQLDGYQPKFILKEDGSVGLGEPTKVRDIKIVEQ